MSSLINILNKKFQKSPAIIQFLIVTAVILLIRYLLHFLIYSNHLTSYLETFGNPKSMIYFHMNGCGHCKKFTPTWDNFSSKYVGPLKLMKYEQKEAGKEMLEKYEIQGFPTVILVDDKGDFKTYEGDRTISGLESFANNQ